MILMIYQMIIHKKNLNLQNYFIKIIYHFFSKFTIERNKFNKKISNKENINEGEDFLPKRKMLITYIF